MPQYKYNCKDCNKSFSIYASMNDSKENIICEHCKSSNVHRVFSGIITKSGGLSGDDSSSYSSVGSSSGSSCGSCSSGSCGSCH